MTCMNLSMWRQNKAKATDYKSRTIGGLGPKPQTSPQVFEGPTIKKKLTNLVPIK